MYLLIKHEVLVLFKKFVRDEMEFFDFSLEVAKLHVLGLERFYSLNSDEAKKLEFLADTSSFEDFYDYIFCLCEGDQIGVGEIKCLISSHLKEFI